MELVDQAVSMDGSYTLCVLCCCSFGSGSHTTASICRQDLLNFFKILVESPPHFAQDTALSVQDLQRILDSSALSICSDCHAFIAVALETRSRAEQMELAVRKLQKQILDSLRALNSEMDLFHQEMTKIESVVKTSDETCLLFHMPRTTQLDSDRGNGVMVLRERILDVVTDLRIYQVSCTDTRLPVDESEVEAMWEDAQQLVQCTPDISIEDVKPPVMQHFAEDVKPPVMSPFMEDVKPPVMRHFVEDFNDSSGGGGMEEDPILMPETVLDEGTLYMGHAVGTQFYVEGESDDNEDSLGMSLPSDTRTAIKNFKEDVIKRAIAREQTRTHEQNTSSDPLRRYYLRYDVKREKLYVGNVEVIINEEDETLQCSQCSIMGKRSKSNHQSKQNWRDMEKGVLVHIIGKHLGGFTCFHCQEVFTSHTMIKKHVSFKHAGQTVSSITTVATPPPATEATPHDEKPTQKRKPYACNMCPSAFSKPSELKRHFLAKHAAGQQVELVTTTTVLAPMTPPTPTPVSRKNVAKRSKGAPGTTGTQTVYVAGGTPEKAIPTKSAQRPHECQVCKYAFTKGSHLKRHLEVHRKRNELV